jgi:aryl-alcohol dehydrogenase-like predicted oxidoreductase
MIERRTVGASGLQVSALSLGTMTFARTGSYARIAASEADMARMIDIAFDAGIDTFDTANVYGESETILGELLGARRHRAVISTKVRFATNAGERPGFGEYGLSRHAVIYAVEASLRRLKTDFIDVLHLHMQDRLVPIEETLRAVDDLVSQGKVRYLGVSNYAAYRLVEALWSADRRGLTTVTSLQVPWSLLSRDVERELIPAARHFRLGVLIYSPLARGLLAGKYHRGDDPPAGTRLAEWRKELTDMDTPATWRIVDALHGIARAREVPPSVVAIAWCLSMRPVASVILGARNVEQLVENLRAAELRLTRDEIASLNRVSEPAWGYPSDFIGRFEPW